MCTLHSFDGTTSITAWRARSEFEGAFEKAPAEANSYLAKPDEYRSAALGNPDASTRENVEKVAAVLLEQRAARGAHQAVARGRRDSSKSSSTIRFYNSPLRSRRTRSRPRVLRFGARRNVSRDGRHLFARAIATSIVAPLARLGQPQG